MKFQGILRSLAPLLSLQLITMAAPLFVIPFIARSLNPEGLGIIAFFQAISTYIMLFCEFGTEFSGTRHIAYNRNNKEIVSDRFYNILILKVVIASLILLFSIIPFLFFKIINSYPTIYFLSILMGGVQGFSLNWYFQAIDQLAKVSFIEIILRVMIALMVIIFVNSSENIYLYFLINVVFLTINMLINYWLAIKDLCHFSPKIITLKDAFFDSYKIFFYKVISTLYSSGNTIALGVFLQITYAGYYAYSEKVILAVRGGLGTFIRVLFSRINSALSESKSKAMHDFIYSSFFFVFLNLLVAIVISYYSNEIVLIIFGKGYDEVGELLVYMAFLLPIKSLSTAVSTLWLIPNGYEEALGKIITVSVAFHLPIMIYLVFEFQHYGALAALFFTETLTAIATLGVYFRISKSKTK